MHNDVYIISAFLIRSNRYSPNRSKTSARLYGVNRIVQHVVDISGKMQNAVTPKLRITVAAANSAHLHQFPLRRLQTQLSNHAHLFTLFTQFRVESRNRIYSDVTDTSILCIPSGYVYGAVKRNSDAMFTDVSSSHALKTQTTERKKRFGANSKASDERNLLNDL